MAVGVSEKSDKVLTVGIVAGEASGDQLAAPLMRAIKNRFPNATFRGIGGEKMLAEGFLSYFPQDRLAVMGLIEPLKRLPELLRIRRFLEKEFLAHPPDIFIGIDSPDFNLGLEIELKKAGIKTVHYVSPSVWAWRQKRIFKIAKAVDLMLTLFPFELPIYQKHRIAAVCVGHTLADQIPHEINVDEAKTKLSLPTDCRYVAILPGSRANEVARMAPVMIEVARRVQQQMSGVRFLIAAASEGRRLQIENFLNSNKELPISLIDGQSLDVMAASDVVVMASGTTTLEAMLLKKPMVVTYKMAAFSFWLLSRLVKVRWVGLPNLLANKGVVPEFLQNQAQPAIIADAVLNYLNDGSAVEELKQLFLEQHRMLQLDASEKAACAIVELLGKDIGKR